MKNYYLLLSIFIRKYGLWAVLLLYFVITTAASGPTSEHVMDWIFLSAMGAMSGMYLEITASTPMMTIWPNARRRLFRVASSITLIALLVDVAAYHANLTDPATGLALRFVLVSGAFLAGYTGSYLILLLLLLPVTVLLVVVDIVHPQHIWISFPLGIWFFCIVRRKLYRLNEDSREYFQNTFQDPDAVTPKPATKIQENRSVWGEAYYDSYCADKVTLPDYWRRYPRLAHFLHWRAAIGPNFNPRWNMTISIFLIPFIVFIFSQVHTPDSDIDLDVSSVTFLMALIIMSWFSASRRQYLPLELALPQSRRDYVLRMGGMRLIAVLTDTLVLAGCVLLSLAVFDRTALGSAKLWEVVAFCFSARLTLFALVWLADTFAGTSVSRWWYSSFWVLWLGSGYLSNLLKRFGIDFTLSFNSASLICLLATAILLPLAYRRWLVQEI